MGKGIDCLLALTASFLHSQDLTIRHDLEVSAAVLAPFGGYKADERFDWASSSGGWGLPLSGWGVSIALDNNRLESRHGKTPESIPAYATPGGFWGAMVFRGL